MRAAAPHLVEMTYLFKLNILKLNTFQTLPKKKRAQSFGCARFIFFYIIFCRPNVTYRFLRAPAYCWLGRNDNGITVDSFSCNSYKQVAERAKCGEGAYLNVSD